MYFYHTTNLTNSLSPTFYDVQLVCCGIYRLRFHQF